MQQGTATTETAKPERTSHLGTPDVFLGSKLNWPYRVTLDIVPLR